MLERRLSRLEVEKINSKHLCLFYTNIHVGVRAIVYVSQLTHVRTHTPMADMSMNQQRDFRDADLMDIDGL